MGDTRLLFAFTVEIEATYVYTKANAFKIIVISGLKKLQQIYLTLFLSPLVVDEKKY